MKVAVRADRAAPVRGRLPGQAGEPATGLLDDHLQRSQIPQRHLGVETNFAGPFGPKRKYSNSKIETAR